MEQERVTSSQQPRKSDVCEAIIDRANQIACAVAENDHGIVRGIWDNFHTKYPELQALLLALTLLADKDDHLIPGFIASLRQHVDVGETYVWTLPHPAPRYTGWLHRLGKARRDGRLVTALRLSNGIRAEESIC